MGCDAGESVQAVAESLSAVAVGDVYRAEGGYGGIRGLLAVGREGEVPDYSVYAVGGTVEPVCGYWERALGQRRTARQRGAAKGS